MNPFQHAFENLTQPQADVLTAATTLLSALIVTIFAPLMFHLLTKKGFRDFNTASDTLRKAADRVDTQAETVSKAMGRVRSGVDEFRDMLGSLQQSLANTQNTLIDAQDAQSTPTDTTVAADKNRETVRDLWRAIQGLVEQAAAKESINGNTRAKYTRWDRRNYLGLIEAIHQDKNLPGDLKSWQDAFWIGQQAIRGAAPITDQLVQRMEILFGVLSALVTGGEPQHSPNKGIPSGQYVRPSIDKFKGYSNKGSSETLKTSPIESPTTEGYQAL